MALPVSTTLEGTLEGVQEKLWCALPCIVKLKSEIMAAAADAADTAGDATPETVVEKDLTTSAIRTASVPFSDMRQLVECLFTACHRNPIMEDVEKGVKAILGSVEAEEGTQYTWDDFLRVLVEVESRWLEWHDPEKKWLAVSEKQHISVLKELADCVTHDVEPFALLPHQEVLTAQSVVAHSKTLVTPFEAFVEFVKPPEFSEIYNTLWELLTQPSEEPGDREILPIEQFTEFFKWFYMRIFTNATEGSATVAARTMWIENLNAQGVMKKRQFVKTCQRMCRMYASETDTASCLENFFCTSVEALQQPESVLGMKLFQHREPSAAFGRILVDPMDLYIAEELDEVKQEMELYDTDVAANRIIVCGRRGVGKTTVAKALAMRLNCIHLSLEELALEAVTKADAGDALGAELCKCVDSEALIPLSLLMALVRRKISTDEALYRGYVFSDFPSVHDAADADVLEFLNGCGILDVLVPSVILHLSCDDGFYPDRLDATLKERRALHDSERQLCQAAEEEWGEKDSRLQELMDRVEKLRETIKRYEEMSAADADALDPTELEVMKSAAAEAEKELPEAIAAQEEEAEKPVEVSPESAEREKQIKSLILRRLLEWSLRGDKPGKEMYVTELPCFQEIVERLHSVGRCLSVGCTSLVEDTVAYAVETLRLEPCVLPRDLTAERASPPQQHKGEEDATLILEREEEMARVVEEAATGMGATFSTRWKRFCPVTFTECGVLVEGAGNYGCVFRQRLYHLASEAKLAKFTANPLPYLRPMPLNREPILLLSILGQRGAARCLPPPAQTELIWLLHQQLELTPIEFNEFVALWDKHRRLKELREQALAARVKFELTERKLRAERLKKRRAAQLRKEKKPKPPPTGKNRRSRKLTVSQPEEEEFKGWEQKPEGPETATSRIEKAIAEQLNRRKSFVPVLVYGFENIFVDVVDQLLSEGVMPEQVIVLQYERSSGEGAKDAASSVEEEASMEDASKEEVKLPQEILLEKLENPTRPGTGEREESPAQRFTIHHVNVNDKDARILTAEILQLVCSGMAPVEAGIVDDALGEMEGEEAEMELDEEDENDEGLAAEVVNAALRPGKRFLNQFGSRLQYCPVTLHEKRLLLCGKNELCSLYQNKLYVFASEEAMAKFECNPLRYLEMPPTSPPPRVWIVGYTKSGRKTLGRKLHEQYNVPFFTYDRRFFERCIEAARKPGGEVIDGIPIAEQGSENSYLVLAETILKEVRDFAAEQERSIKLREEAEAVMERREQAQQNEDDEDDDEENEEMDEEAEARLQEYLEFEPEADEDRDLRLSEAYLKIASCVTRIEPFESEGYIMVCPPFSEGDIEVLFTTGCIPESTVKLDLSEELFFAYNKASQHVSGAATGRSVVSKVSQEEMLKKMLEKEKQKKERELRKWRRRHIGKDDPDSEVDEESEEGSPLRERDGNEASGAADDDDAVMESLKSLRSIEKGALEEFEEAITERFVKLVSLSGDLSPNAVFHAVTRQLFRFLEHRRSILYTAEVLRFDNAVKMLEYGGAFLSYFGYTDPVALYNKRHGVRRVCKWMPNGTTLEPEPSTEVEAETAAAMPANEVDGDAANGREEPNSDTEGEEAGVQEEQAPLQRESASGEDMDDEEMSEYDDEEMEEIRERYERRKRRDWLRRCQRVALFCGRLYFFDSDESLLQYLRDPLLYVQQPPPLPQPLTRPVVSVYDGTHALLHQGALKQRCTANHIAFNLDFIFVSLSKLLSWAAVHAPLLSLSRRAIAAVIAGSVDDALVADLLVHRLNAGDAKRRGVVLLNLPKTPEQYKLLGGRELRVDKVFSFDETRYTDVTALITATATVTTSLSVPSDTIAAIAEITEYVNTFIRNEGRALLCFSRGFPMSMDNTYHTTAEIESHLSSYQWFCPYNWCLHKLLLDQRESRLYGAKFLDKYYFFSSNEYLQRFLLNPGELSAPPGLSPLPTALPSRMPPGTEYSLELLGCCPVTLWDTRETRGLRGVLEPVAKKGDPSCVVEYEGRYYALLDEAALKRFLMRPWTFIAGAFLPPSRKAPLPEGHTLLTIEEETFMRRILYDPVAYALIAVAEARPKYPGLSLEESALKFVALHMKCFNTKNTPIQTEKYRANYEAFRKRATLYRSMTVASEDEVQDEAFLQLCKEWEIASGNKQGGVSGLVHLPRID
ncbi:hypothetical protein TraAM80_04453 [Trypanosoma rangeli]|uniref:Cilia- and flagella-associated protein 206 n=1 Tax=Trypanosoma rangeli TaxID=5698 RepID=A0A3S5IRA7_TRYRA|nr:uncharacterized protein TraAM80_04453 [Trypanosoma rangeli]RNF05531.1 hypothetical protein TraAM80_04453 [Trypanosoma rangeli]|eukprot:RNF05531.1 hypothetical protein TraAM80_04453 [Trypanosoma rangeli]